MFQYYFELTQIINRYTILQELADINPKKENLNLLSIILLSFLRKTQ